jgi:hypothetical protein
LQTNFQPCCQAQTFRYFATPLAIVIAGYTAGAIYSFNRNLFEYSSAIYSKFTSKNLATGSDWISSKKSRKLVCEKKNHLCVKLLFTLLKRIEYQ